MEPCPGESFIGTPVIACASDGLNIEQGSICACGDCGWVSLLPTEAGEDGAGVAGVFPALPEEEPLQETNRSKQNIALLQKTLFIMGLRIKCQILNESIAGFAILSGVPLVWANIN
jgi:hypothetical protein